MIGEKYTRVPVDCGKCRVEHGVSPFHYGPDPNADCGKCIADSVLKELEQSK
jgi:bacterioferritin-associated ferredoxin